MTAIFSNIQTEGMPFDALVSEAKRAYPDCPLVAALLKRTETKSVSEKLRQWMRLQEPFVEDDSQWDGALDDLENIIEELE